MQAEKETQIDVVECSRRLRNLRTSRGLSHAALGSAVGISEQSLKNYEQAVLKDGKTDTSSARVNAIAGMNIETLFRLARYFGVNSDYLLGLSDDPSPDITLKTIANTTGMTSAAIRRIMCMYDSPLSIDAAKTRQMLNNLFEKGSMEQLISALCSLSMTVEAKQPAVDSFEGSGISSLEEFEKLMEIEKAIKYARFDYSEEAGRIINQLLGVDNLLQRIESIKQDYFKQHFNMEVE